MFAVRSLFTGRPVRRRRPVRSLPTLLVVAASLLLVAIPLPHRAVAGPSLGPWLIVDRDVDAISGSDFPVGETVTITIDRPTIPGNPDYTTHGVVGPSGTFVIDVSHDFDVRTGDVVTATAGSVSATHEVTHLWATGSDPMANNVRGKSDANAAIWSRVEPSGPEVTAWSDNWGTWDAQFPASPGLKAGDRMTFSEKDDTNNWTRIDRVYPIPYDSDRDTIDDAVDNCLGFPNMTQYDGDGDGIGAICDHVDRLWGSNRYGTSAAVSRMTFEQSDVAFIALGTNFPDALVAAAAGGYRDSPVLLTSRDSLPSETAAELIRLRPQIAYIVGGTAVISPHVADQIDALVPDVVRLAGANRYETSAAVSKEIFPTANEAFVALGENFPDALVAAAAAGFHAAPVLLTRKDHVPQATLDELHRLQPSTIYVVGGPAAVSDTAAVELASYGTVERLAGANRYETSAKVAERFFDCFTCNTRAFLAYGGNFPDALVAAAAGGYLRAPVLLVTHDSIPSSTRKQLDRLKLDNVWLVGGTAVIGDSVVHALPSIP